MKVIALTGRAGSGKDTAATMLQILTGAMVPKHAHVNGRIDLNKFISNSDNFLHKFDQLNRNEGFDIYKFAFPVYKIVANLLGVPDAHTLMNQTFKDSDTPFGMTGRELLQKVGTECFRDVLGKETWCTVLMNELEADAEDEHFKGAIISDLRFLNEEEFLRNRYETYVIYMSERHSGLLTTHASEKEIQLIRPDLVIPNNGTYTDLMNQLSLACKYLDILDCKYNW